jgi:hypothetical protein
MSLRNKLFFILLLAGAPGCKKYLELPLPVNEIAGSASFTNNVSAAAMVNNIYRMLNGSLFQGAGSIPYNTGLYTDELTNAATSGSNLAFYTDALTGTNAAAVTAWTSLYEAVYDCNLTIEGLQPSSLTMRNQLLGEVYFLRAFSNFYLTNLYGTIPLALTSDYATNNQLARSTQVAVYTQIIADLKQAQSLLTDDYLDLNGNVTTDRGRPNRMAATALLARAYLYTSDWPDAEAQADSLIGAASTYQLTTPAGTFLTGSQETIWGLAPGGPSYDIADVSTYFIAQGTTPLASNVNCYLSNGLVNAFEPGDTRFTNWIGVSNVPASGGQPAANYYYAYKYKVRTGQSAPAEYLSELRLGELYLIRAEARAEQNNITGTTGAAADLNVVRARAGLAPTAAATQATMLTAILHERQVELFAEGGHRLLDLRRTGNLNAVMNAVAPSKNASWSSYAQWWPIASSDIVTDPNLVQTPGY